MPGSGIGMLGDKSLPKQGVADLAQIRHQAVENIFRQPIVEFVYQAADRAQCIRPIANAHFGFRERRIPIGIRPYRVAERCAQILRYRRRRRLSF